MTLWVMDALCHGPHGAFSIHQHVVWVTTFRKPALAGAVGVRVRDLSREVCGTLEVHIIRGHVSRDHMHLLVSIPPTEAVLEAAPVGPGVLLPEQRAGDGQVWKEYIENQGRGGDTEFGVEGDPGELQPLSGRTPSADLISVQDFESVTRSYRLSATECCFARPLDVTHHRGHPRRRHRVVGVRRPRCRLVRHTPTRPAAP